MEFLTPFVLLWALQAVGGQTDCPALQIADLGEVRAPSTTGLVAATIAAESGNANTSIQIMAVNVVCLGQGTMRDLYRSVSLVLRYLDGADSTMNIVQVEYQCMAMGGGVWGFGSGPSITTAPTGTLTTSLRTDCILCVDPNAAMSVTVSPDEHCTGN